MSQIQVTPKSHTKAWRKALAANYAGSFPTVNPDFVANQAGGEITVASGQALIHLGTQIVPSEVHIVPFGAGSATNTFKMRVWGFRAATGGFIGTLLWAGTCTLCTQTGTLGFDVLDTDLFCDTITTTVGTESVDCRSTSPGSNIPGKVKILTAGSQFLVLDFDKNSSATSCNALVGEE